MQIKLSNAEKERLIARSDYQTIIFDVLRYMASRDFQYPVLSEVKAVLEKDLERKIKSME